VDDIPGSSADALELQVNVSNQNLKAAEAQFQQARAVLRYYRADYYPTVTAGPSATRTRVSANSPTTQLLAGATYNDFVLPFDVSYQADVWGAFEKMWSPTVSKHKPVRQTWLRSI